MGAGSSFINSQHLLWQESPSPTPGAPNIPPESFQGQSPGSKLNCGCFPLCMVCRASLVALREHLEIKREQELMRQGELHFSELPLLQGEKTRLLYEVSWDARRAAATLSPLAHLSAHIRWQIIE